MKNILSIFLIMVFMSAWTVVDAQQQAKVAKLGLLNFRSASDSSPGSELLVRALLALGYVEGKNIVFEYRYAEGKDERFPTLADELVKLKVDVLLTPGTPATLAAKTATRTIPIVFTAVADPVPTGLVDSLARPGGNITGFTEISEVLAGKRLELLKETIPKLSRVAVLWNPKNPGNAQQWKESQLAGKKLGLQLHSLEISSADKYEGAFKEAIKARSAALAVAQDSLAQFNLKLIAALATKNRLPAIYSRGEFVDSGGLMSYGPDSAETYKRAASMIDKILKGTKPADIPVEQPTKFEFVINLKTAKQLGVTVPPEVLARANRIIR
jgi:putative tryptophan/tyrosine transport system substrate-binding protein